MDTDSGKVSRWFPAIGILLLFSGYLLYFLFRDPSHLALQALPGSDLIQWLLPHAPGRPSWTGWAPSFIHVLAFSLITAGLFGVSSRSRYAIPSFWLFVSIVFELGQKYHFTASGHLPWSWAGTKGVRVIDGYFLSGTFDYADMAAAIAGFLAASVLLHTAGGLKGMIPGNLPRILQYMRHVLTSVVFAFGILCMLATSYIEHCNYEPVYLSYEELRQPIAATDSRPVKGGGKIYLYGKYLFVNQLNEGIHVIDNSEPGAPVNLMFIPIPGNMDIAVKDYILYADSYIDMVAIDISDIGNIHEVKRIMDIFSYDPYQNISDPFAYVCSYSRENGVVVDVKKRQPAKTLGK